MESLGISFRILRDVFGLDIREDSQGHHAESCSIISTDIHKDILLGYLPRSSRISEDILVLVDPWGRDILEEPDGYPRISSRILQDVLGDPLGCSWISYVLQDPDRVTLER